MKKANADYWKYRLECEKADHRDTKHDFANSVNLQRHEIMRLQKIIERAKKALNK